MDLELSGTLFGEDFINDVFVDADLLKHEVEPQPLHQPAPAALPPQQPPDSAFLKYNRELATHCEKVTQALTYELRRLGWAQKRGAGDAPALAAMRERLLSVEGDTFRVLNSSVLLASALASLLSLRELVRVMLVQVEILQEEVLQRGRLGAPRLVLLGGARVAKKDSPLGAPLRARVLTGTREVHAVGPVELVCEEGVPLAGAQVQLDPQSGEADLSGAAFGSGSAGKVVRLRARARVAVGGAPAELTSVGSVLSVATTTEGQWAQAQGRLVAAQLFGEHQSLPWPRVANELQRLYLEGTRQNPAAPLRALAAADLAYVHQFKFGCAPTVTGEAFEEFWSWFGPALMGLRHSRLLLHLWCQGYVTGFVSKKAAETLLSNCTPGAFLLRFSERAAGTFAVAYVKVGRATGQPCVKHYLLRAGDVAPPQRTLADFLGAQSYFQWLLVTLPAAGPTDTARWKLVRKDEAFGEFYGVRGQTFDGYEEEVGKE